MARALRLSVAVMFAGAAWFAAGCGPGGGELWPRPQKRTGPPKMHEYVFDSEKGKVVDASTLPEAKRPASKRSTGGGSGGGVALFASASPGRGGGPELFAPGGSKVAPKPTAGAAGDGADDAISDIPLGGSGAVGTIGVGGGGAGAFGFRSGGGRKRAVVRAGGSAATEKSAAPAAADAGGKDEVVITTSLAMKAEPEYSEKKVRDVVGTVSESAVDVREEVETKDHAETADGHTGLAVKAFLGAGHTEGAGKAGSAAPSADGGPGDTSVTGWSTTAVKSKKIAGTAAPSGSVLAGLRAEKGDEGRGVELRPDSGAAPVVGRLFVHDVRDASTTALLLEAEPAKDGGGIGAVLTPPAAERGATKTPAPARPKVDAEYRKKIDAAAKLQGGSKDDNEHFDEYLEYRDRSKDKLGKVCELDVARRHVIRVTGSAGLPLPNATVVVKAGGKELWRARTCSDGTTIFFPGAVGAAGAKGSYTVEVKGPYGTGWEELDPEQSDDVTVELARRRPKLKPRLDLLFCLDTTGSMSDEILRIQRTLRDVVAKISALPAKPSIRFALVEYRDRRDAYVSRRYDFTDDIDEFVKVIETIRAGGGGDTPESVNEALHRAVSEPEWDEGAVRLVLLVGDAPPHMDYEKDFSYGDEAVAAAGKGVRVYTLAASGLDATGEYIFRQISQFTGARFLFITYGGSTKHSVGEFKGGNNLDDIIVKVVSDELAGMRSVDEGERRAGGEPEEGADEF